METSTEDRIATLLARAEAAHRAFEADTLGGQRDEQWAPWYAAFLIEHGLNDLLEPDRSFTIEQLERRLVAADAAYRQAQPEVSWPVAYAQRLLDPRAGQG